MWIHQFLTNRLQTVSANGAMSTEHKVTSGVPQGTVLGPILFLIMIGDIDEDIAHSKLASFVDYTNVCKSLKSREDVDLLQEDLDKIYRWAKKNNMMFNDEKFQLLR